MFYSIQPSWYKCSVGLVSITYQGNVFCAFVVKISPLFNQLPCRFPLISIPDSKLYENRVLLLEKKDQWSNMRDSYIGYYRRKKISHIVKNKLSCLWLSVAGSQVLSEKNLYNTSCRSSLPSCSSDKISDVRVSNNTVVSLQIIFSFSSVIKIEST